MCLSFWIYFEKYYQPLECWNYLLSCIPLLRKKKTKQEEEKIEESLPEVSGEKFFDVDPSFQKLLKSQKTKDDREIAEDEKMEDEDQGKLELTNNKPFSLLSLFGKAEETREEESIGNRFH